MIPTVSNLLVPPPPKPTTVREVLEGARSRGFLEKRLGLPFEERDAFEDIECCRTVFCGGRLFECPGCGHQKAVFASCGNRLCPSCGHEDKAKWVERRWRYFLKEERYFHAVLKLPKELWQLARWNKKVILDVVLKAAAMALKKVAWDRLGVEVGFTAVLETAAWDLFFDPHVHIMGPAVGLTSDRSSFRRFREDTFPEAMLQRVFKEETRRGLVAKYWDLKLSPPQHQRSGFDAFKTWLGDSSLEWRCRFYMKSSDEARTLIPYLSKEIATGPVVDEDLVVSETGNIETWRDRWDEKRGIVRKVLCSLAPDEFTSRYLMHALPRRFHQSRDYGFYAGPDSAEKVKALHELLGSPVPKDPEASASGEDAEGPTCPKCEEEMELQCQWGKQKPIPDEVSELLGSAAIPRAPTPTVYVPALEELHEAGQRTRSPPQAVG